MSGNRFVASSATMNLALHARRAGRQPLQTHRESLQRLYESRNWLNIWPVVESVAALLATTGNAEGAATVLGHLEAHRRITYLPLPRTSRREATLQALNQHPDLEKWMTHGAQLDSHQLVTYALAALQDEPA